MSSYSALSNQLGLLLHAQFFIISIIFQDNSLHDSNILNVDLQSIQLTSSTQQEVQKHTNSKSLYEDFMFGGYRRMIF